MTEIALTWEIMLGIILAIGGLALVFHKATPGPLFRGLGVILVIAGLVIVFPTLLAGTDTTIPATTAEFTDITTQAESAYNASSMAYPHGTPSSDYLLYTIPVAASSYVSETGYVDYQIRAQFPNGTWANITSTNLSSTSLTTIPSPLTAAFYFNVSQRIIDAPLLSGIGFYADYDVTVDVPTYTKGSTVHSVATLNSDMAPIVYMGTTLTNTMSYLTQKSAVNNVQFNISLDWTGIQQMTLYSSQDITVTTEYGDTVVFRLTRSL